MKKNITLIFLCIISILTCAPAFAEQPSHALSLYGDIKYPATFTHFNYVNPDAPKGGDLKFPALGTFDSLNPYTIKGTAADGIDALTGVTLMTQSYDEPFTMYGYVAETATRAADNAAITFNLRTNAVWDDGKSITADDVVWTFNTLIKDGAPFYRAYYADIKSVKADSPTQVTFTFKTTKNRELPLIVAQMPILPKHYWEGKDFSSTSTAPPPPVAAGPYHVTALSPGRSIQYERNPTWWGNDLPINKGRYNFDTITYTYYRDQNVMLEAFFAGEFDVQQESVAKLWQSAYDAPAVKDGRIIKREIANSRPAGMQGFLYNTRRPIFADIDVRKALSYVFDFDWENKQFASGTYTRTRSYFQNSDLAASGLPSPEELKLLEPFKENLPAEVFTTEYNPPTTDGTGNNRVNLKTASDILDAAGYKVGADGIRVNSKTGVRLEFEFMESNPAFERWILPFTQNLKKIGVKCNFRVIDSAQYENRMRNFDFDITTNVIAQSNSPGNEQRDFWMTDKADIKGSRNYIGVKNPAVDALVRGLIAANTREELVTHTRALDRVLQWNYYAIPNWHFGKWRLAWWSKLDHPATLSGQTPAIVDTWWVKAEK